MAKMNRKLVVAGATVLTLAGVTLASAYIASYQTRGSNALTATAGAEASKATVTLSVNDQNAVTNALTAGPQGVVVPVVGTSTVATRITASDLLPDLMLPVGCPTDGWSIGQPTLTVPNGQVPTGAPQQVGTFVLALDTNVGVAQDSCFNTTGNFVLAFGPSGGVVFGAEPSRVLAVTSICKMPVDGTPKNYTEMGAFLVNENVFRIRNVSGAPFTWTLDGTTKTGELQPGATTFVAGPSTAVVRVPALGKQENKAANSIACVMS
jgi:hypothetical protein